MTYIDYVFFVKIQTLQKYLYLRGRRSHVNDRENGYILNDINFLIIMFFYNFVYIYINNTLYLLLFI